METTVSIPVHQILNMKLSKEYLEQQAGQLSIRDLAKKLAISESTILRIQRKFGIKRGNNGHLIAQKSRQYQYDISHFSTMDDIGSYQLGVVYIIGHVIKTSKGKVFYLKAPLKKAQLIADFLKAIGSTHEPKTYKRNSKWGGEYAKIQLSHRELIDIMCKYGLETKQMPKIYHINHFLDGLAAAGGQKKFAAWFKLFGR